MKINKTSAISTKNVLLVPYEAHHVLRYHAWMQDPDIQEATASEPMTIEEEYENQQSWRTARDKLTFILCAPLAQKTNDDKTPVQATHADAEDKMMGDINFFLYPHDEEDDGEHKGWLTGEVDVMIAEKQQRGQGIGQGAVCALLVYIHKHLDRILEEHADGERTGILRGLMVKIKEGNTGSRALFSKLGFIQAREVNYFGEVTMVMGWEDLVQKKWWDTTIADYHEVSYGLKS